MAHLVWEVFFLRVALAFLRLRVVYSDAGNPIVYAWPVAYVQDNIRLRKSPFRVTQGGVPFAYDWVSFVSDTSLPRLSMQICAKGQGRSCILAGFPLQPKRLYRENVSYYGADPLATVAWQLNRTKLKKRLLWLGCLDRSKGPRCLGSSAVLLVVGRYQRV